MKVVSKLVELDFEISKIEKTPSGIVILNDPGKAMATKVHVSVEDAVSIAKVVLTSPVALLFMATFPFTFLRRKLGGGKAAPARKR